MEDIFSTSFSWWHDNWILYVGATCHMTFRRDLFEQLSDNIDGVVYFVDNSQIKPSGIGSIHLKIPRLSDYTFEWCSLHLWVPNKFIISCINKTTGTLHPHIWW